MIFPRHTNPGQFQRDRSSASAVARPAVLSSQVSPPSGLGGYPHHGPESCRLLWRYFFENPSRPGFRGTGLCVTGCLPLVEERRGRSSILLVRLDTRLQGPTLAGSVCLEPALAGYLALSLRLDSAPTSFGASSEEPQFLAPQRGLRRSVPTI